MSAEDPKGVAMTAPGVVRVFWIFAMLFAGCLALGLAVHAYRHDRLLAVASMVLLAVAEIWGCWRAWTVRLGLDANGLTVRNCFRTYRFRWTAVHRFTNGSVYMGDQSPWALRVVLRDGRKVTAAGTARATDSNAKITAIGSPL
jgi:Bacterial PH domain